MNPIGPIDPIQSEAWSKNPKSITIGEADTSTFEFEYQSPGGDISKTLLNPDNVINNNSTKFKINKHWVSVTVVGNKKGSGEVNLKITTYDVMGKPVENITTIKVVEARIPNQIKFFDTDNNPLADNKLIAPKHIYDISQGKNNPSNGTKLSTSNKCLKTTDSSEYVKFTYSKLGSHFDQIEYSWVTLSDSFALPSDSFGIPLPRSGRICLKGIKDDTSRNITKNMLQENGDDGVGHTYWYIIDIQKIDNVDKA